MLTFAEEIYLLALDDVSGKVTISSRDIVLNSALIGAAISELCFLGRLDNDSEFFYLVDSANTGDAVLDRILGVFAAAESKKNPIDHCLRVLLPQAGNIERHVLESLTAKKILRKVEGKILWIFPTRRYPVADESEVMDVERRLRKLLDSDEIPSPREAVLVSLVNVCGLFHEILSPREFNRFRERIEQIAKLDLLGQKVVELIRQINDFANLPPFV